MFEQDKILIPERRNEESFEEEVGGDDRLKRLIIIVGSVVGVLILIIAIFVLVSSCSKEKPGPILVDEEDQEDVIDPSQLPNLNGGGDEDLIPGSVFNPGDLNIEYLSFSDFYQKPDNIFTANIDDYSLPINIKVDGFNYYSLSRKINLDPAIDHLNNNGFALLENPWQNEADDFYSIYKRLEERQIPLLITSDFMVYYHQNMMKQIYKEIEEGVFYDFLWTINKDLYQTAKNRYENRLAAMGNINDVILEAQRMEMAFFAVSLELLKPATDQVAIKGAIEDKTKFSEGDVNKFSFNVPSYLRDDVLREVQLIRSGRNQVKSPNLLYVRDYGEFAVPKEYKSDAKLNNFYLASTWLSSLFPLEYRSEACPDCLLDQEDWRISMIAASYISSDLSASDDLKARWAIIYKLMAFFQGLREELDYVDFRDSLIAIFGGDYDVESIFGGDSKELMLRLERLKEHLLQYEFSEIRGAIDKDKKENTKKLGLKILTGAYWPNDYILSRLTWPKIGLYQSADPGPGNITACKINNRWVRCNSYGLDIVNLVSPMQDNDVFIENSNYLDYTSSADTLIQQLNRDGIWHTSNYWSTISLMRAVIDNQLAMPVFASSTAWEKQNINTAISAWINLQVPLDKFSLSPIFEGKTLDTSFGFDQNIYVEPNLSLINELLAINNMIASTFSALGLNKEVNIAAQTIKSIDEDLVLLQTVIEKELKNEPIDEDEAEALRDFAKRYQIDKFSRSTNTLKHNSVLGGTTLTQDISKLKLKAVVHQVDGNKLIVVGPVWSYRESR